jgi:hypothetical protein
MESELSQIESKLIRLDSALFRNPSTSWLAIDMDRLRIRHKQRLKALNRAKAKIAPIRRVPLEVMSDIFIFSLHNSKRSSIFDVRHAPHVLCRVSSSWRRLAISTPHLSYMHLEGWEMALMTERGHETNTLALIDTWLVRSGGLPLSLFVDFSSSQNISESFITLVLDVLSRHMSRWRYVHLHLSDRTEFHCW